MPAAPEIERADTFLKEMGRRSLDEPGVTRASFGEGEQMAHDMMRVWARELDLRVSTDPAEKMDIEDFAEACALLHGMLDELVA